MRDWRKREAEGLLGPDGRPVLSERMSTFRRLYRWANLTLIQQGVWPLLLLLTTAPAVEVAATPSPWFWARLGAPALAALASWGLLRQPPTPDALVPADLPVLEVARPEPADPTRQVLLRQLSYLLLGLPIMLAVARLVVGPTVPAARVLSVGLAEVAAYHLVNFGVIPRSYVDRSRGLAVGTLLFALSWGLHDLLLTAFGPGNGSWLVAGAVGVLVGGVVAAASRLLQRLPHGYWVAAATHYLVVVLVFGFA